MPRTHKKAVAHSRICSQFLALEISVSSWLSMSCSDFWIKNVLFGAKICDVLGGGVGVICWKVSFVV